ncbi:hypothetical protein F4821DRAFT_54554 [Hypoxylon rubiginosum]|uniref:Uncharacterized protein n=1 Tax=Hypoxylon rubiginosum TaxID=110542 RepID=A0ACC0CJK8_9PEZI|nr:hypothetical protein F4821DRAFT_54554 [Hypoxylon rubiginosum]
MESPAFDFQQRLTEHLIQSLVIGGLVAIALCVVGNEVIRSRARVPGLKGPAGWPVVGNLLDIRLNAALKFQEYAKKYGDVYQVSWTTLKTERIVLGFTYTSTRFNWGTLA